MTDATRTPAAPSYLELGVPDADRARRFYAATLGWTASGTSGPGQVTTDGLSIGIHDHDDEAHFEVFFVVPELETTMTAVTKHGGRLVSDITDAGDFGRYVECADDQGVRFGLRQLP